MDKVFQPGKPFTIEFPGLALIKLRTDVFDHLEVFVRLPDAADENQGGGIRLFQEIFELKAFIAGIDGDQYGSHFTGAVLGIKPFRNIVCPNGNRQKTYFTCSVADLFWGKEFRTVAFEEKARNTGPQNNQQASDDKYMGKTEKIKDNS